MMNTVEIQIKNNRISHINKSVVDIEIPVDLEGKNKLEWVYTHLEERGFILNGDNMKVIPSKE